MIRINLVFDRKAKERARVQQQLVLAVVLVFVTGGISGFLWYSQSHKIEEIKKNINDSKAKLESLKTVINKINDREKKKKRLEEIIKAIGELKKVQRGPTRVFDEINISLPSDIWLTSLSESGGQMRVDGYSFSDQGIAAFMKNLEGGSYFPTVELLEIQQTFAEGEKVKRFSLNVGIRSHEDAKAAALAKTLFSKETSGGISTGVKGGGIYGLGGKIESMYSKEGIEAYGRQLTEDLKSAPRNPFVEAFKYGQLPKDSKEIPGPNIEAAKERAEQLKGKTDQKKREVEERVRQMEGGR